MIWDVSIGIGRLAPKNKEMLLMKKKFIFKKLKTCEHLKGRTD